MSPFSKQPLTLGEMEELARALFVEEERMLPEGDTWETLDYSDRAFYKNAAGAVVAKLRALRGW